MPRFPLLSLTCAIALATGACDRQSADEAQQQENSAAANAEELTGTLDRTQAGGALPQVTVADPSGVTLNLAEASGTPMLLNLWATWCAPCVVEMPMLDALAAETNGRLRVVTVSEDTKGAELVVPFFEEKGFANLPRWMDPDMELAFGFAGGASLPLTVLFDADGKEVWRMVGGFDWSSPEARALIEEALASSSEAVGRQGPADG
jgi:thiol-disulfide isomerase/thioredoxin